jgi:o-succinylbenzoate synthase
MSIASAAASRVRVPFRRPFVTAAGTFDARDAWIVRIRDTAGREGVGEAGLDPAAGPDALAALADCMRAAVTTPKRPPAADDPDPVRRAVAAGFAGAIDDHALHGMPLRSGFVLVNATIATDALDDTLEAVERAIAAGFECLKVKVGDEWSTEAFVERLELIRAVAGDDMELRIDANGAWDIETAIERLTAIGHLRIHYVEQPIPPGDDAALGYVRRRSPIDVAADESVDSASSAAAIVAAAAADVLVLKPGRLGGTGVARGIARSAAAAGVGVTVSNLLETGVGLAAAIRVAAGLPVAARSHAHGLGTASLLVDDLLATRLEVRDGRVAIPAGPLVLDEAAIERWTVDRAGDAR